MRGITRITTTNDREVEDYDYWTISIECKNDDIMTALFDFLKKENCGTVVGCPWDTEEGDNLGDCLAIEKHITFDTKAEWVKDVRATIKKFKKQLTNK